jgi:hypothetical protein
VIIYDCRLDWSAILDIQHCTTAKASEYEAKLLSVKVCLGSLLPFRVSMHQPVPGNNVFYFRRIYSLIGLSSGFGLIYHLMRRTHGGGHQIEVIVWLVKMSWLRVLGSAQPSVTKKI